MRKAKKVLLWLVGGVVSIVLGLSLFWTSIITVGYLNLASSYSSLSDLAHKAMVFPLEPGESALVSSEDGVLVPDLRGRSMEITHKPDGSRFVVASDFAVKLVPSRFIVCSALAQGSYIVT